jgi:diacylglycerol kinase (ATP)
MPESEFKSTGGLKRLPGALKYSTQGLLLMVRHEAAFRQELLVACVLVPLAFWLPLGMVERMLLLSSIVTMLVTEAINSAIEAVVDRVSLERHPLAGRAKDMGSAAVFISVIWLTILWLTLAGPVLWRMVMH